MVKSDSFKNRLKDVPKNPGVYLHSNLKKEIIYVGKANSLQDRLKYYFSPQLDATPKIKELMNNIHDFDFIVTETEQEALLLENQLIKKYQPKYNARLKDDKSYPYIKITKSEEFPQIVISRNPKNDKNKYYGPYSSISSVRNTLNLLSRIFPYRTCSNEINNKKNKECFELQIGRCSEAFHKNDKSQYDEIISNLENFLSGKPSSIIKDLTKEMQIASKEQNYEKAAVYRDRIHAIEKLLEKQKVTGLKNDTFDLICCEKIDNEGMIIIFNIRNGNMVAHEKFKVESVRDTDSKEIIRLFLFDYYSKSLNVPNKILVSSIPNEKEIILDYLIQKSGKNISLKFDSKNHPDIKKYNIGIVVSEWNKDITKNLLSGAIDTLTQHGVQKENIFIQWVPGSFELIFGSKVLSEKEFDVIIAIGCVIKGETDHYDYICSSVSQGIMQLNLTSSMPIIFCILTDHNKQQSIDRSGGKYGNKGVECAFAALQMLSIK